MRGDAATGAAMAVLPGTGPTLALGRGSIGGVTRRHPVVALVLGLVPMVALVGGLPFVNRVEPIVLGLPFLLFWTLGWVLVTPIFLGVAYLLVDTKDDRAADGAER